MILNIYNISDMVLTKNNLTVSRKIVFEILFKNVLNEAFLKNKINFTKKYSFSINILNETYYFV